ncbi:MAG: ribonuclease R [Desulfobulbales bacterium]|nr:ribonuclease R [Desulfobulbales bacterium]
MARNRRSRKSPAPDHGRKGKSSKATTGRGKPSARDQSRNQQLSQLEDEIVGFIYRQGGEANRQEIFSGLQPASRGERKIIDDALETLCREKTLACKGEVYRNKDVKELIEAKISAHPRGFAFARPVTELADTRENDIFIPPGAIGSANHGDRVLIRLTKVRRDKREGRVVTVLHRSADRIVGTWQAGGLVIPEDDRLNYSVRVGPDQAGGAKPGEVVVVEVTDFTGDVQRPAGRVIEILGDSNDPFVQAEIVIHLLELPHRFSPETLQQVEKLTGLIEPEPGRDDLRHIRHVTIDCETAKDFDDAVAIEKAGKNYRLYVSIADVSHYVTTGSPLDQDAYERGTSVYFPGRVVPMLPERLSNDLCSLVPDQDRYAFTAILDFDGQGRPIGQKFGKSLIRSYQRFTYNKVFEILSAPPKAAIRTEYKEFAGDLEMMAKLAAALENQRRHRGSIGFEIPEPEITLDETGRISHIARSHRNQAHKLIEECMLAANEAVARAFSALDHPADYAFLYRIHEEPDPLKVEAFAEFARSIGVALPEGVTGPGWFAKVVEAVKDTPKEYIVSNLLLRTMQQARYSPENAGHFGLAAQDYCHFTSPIRRYPDLMVHRALEQLAGRGGKAERGKPRYSSAEEAGIFLSGRERVAVDAERQVVERLQVRYMAEHLGEDFAAIVSGIASFGVFVELLESFISGVIPLAELPGDFYEVDEKNHRILGKTSGRTIQIGDQIRVKVSEVNIRRRRIDFTLTED